jgi:HD-GYP domain-containing protein (c-di-GMP phosphodiesterase class II)
VIEEMAKIVSCFVSGMSDYRSSRGDPQSVSRHVEQALDIIKALQIEHFFTITVSDDDGMLINGVRMSLDLPEAKKFFLKLRQKGVITIVISKGVRARELQRFLADLATSGGFFHSYAHVAVKRSEQLPRSDMFPTGRGLKDDLLRIKRIYHDISVKGRIDITTVDAVVGSLIANVRKEEGLLALLVSMKEDGDDLYVHSAKVAMLSILQGEHLGLGNALIYDIGFAALLHDIGKTLLPHAILDKQDSLSEAEWTVMKYHPVYGAALLASLDKVPEIAITVAYEHHRKYDGTGYPETRRRPRKQHIISQIVAVADFYCAMSANLPHRKPLSNTSILGLLIETAGREFNPLLVDNFVRAMGGYFPHVS